MPEFGIGGRGCDRLRRLKEGGTIPGMAHQKLAERPGPGISLGFQESLVRLLLHFGEREEIAILAGLLNQADASEAGKLRALLGEAGELKVTVVIEVVSSEQFGNPLHIPTCLKESVPDDGGVAVGEFMQQQVGSIIWGGLLIEPELVAAVAAMIELGEVFGEQACFSEQGLAAHEVTSDLKFVSLPRRGEFSELSDQVAVSSVNKLRELGDLWVDHIGEEDQPMARMATYSSGC